jgi:hypothetical protein
MNCSTPTETIFGGLDLIVAKRDKSTENVFIRQLAVETYPKFLAASEDESAMAELYCAKPAGWARTLSPGSLEAVIVEGERVNADFFDIVSQGDAGKAKPRRGAPAKTNRSLADLCCDIAVEYGLSLPAVRKHSMAQLLVMQRAIQRGIAQRALLNLDATIVAVAAAFSGKDRDYKNLRRALAEHLD